MKRGRFHFMMQWSQSPARTLEAQGTWLNPLQLSERPAVMTGAPQSGLEYREELEQIISWGVKPAMIN